MSENWNSQKQRLSARGFYIYCNCCGKGFSGAPGARAYLDHLGNATYYAAPLSPEATYWLGANAREFLGINTFAEWMELYYSTWKPRGPDIIPAAYGWYSFYGMRKSPEYEAWRKEHNIAIH